ncbi:MAG: hypothetical protein KDK51_05110 [Deltaproteobacteria bacterium]|nr:hypothetical protein [Deltaproteobacteria bacterium]
MQNQLHKNTNNKHSISRKRKQALNTIKFAFHPNDTLTSGTSKEFKGFTKDPNLIRGVYELFQFSSRYLSCQQLEQPLTFILMKHVAYRHRVESIALDPAFPIKNIAWIGHFLPDLNENAKSMPWATYERINRSFTGQKILQDTGWYMRQLLWMEAIYQSKTYSALIPLQLIGVYELIQSAKNIALTPAPSALNVPIVGKKFKKMFATGVDKLSDKIFESEVVKPFKKDLEDLTGKKQRSSYHHQRCKELQQNTAIYKSNRGNHV